VRIETSEGLQASSLKPQASDETDAGRRSSVVDTQLLDTQRAFDSVAADYDGPRGNNALIQRMRETMWSALAAAFAPGARMLDLGCGTGIDAVELAQRGYHVLATDWSPQMVERTRARAAEAGVGDRAAAAHVGIQELDRLRGEQFDGIYSNFGPLNCAPDLAAVSRSCAALLKPGGKLVFSVIGRICPWEFGYYLLRGRLARARVRGARGSVAVNLNRHTVWARYYTPREFYQSFAGEFALAHYQGLSLFMPPPYLVGLYERARPLCELLGRLDDRLGALPLLRDAGDHFLIVMTKR
jgi:2-polyprenyl-3-methyl-5-hydroxy-6-metoxy-1,4-benzoquinol methylase